MEIIRPGEDIELLTGGDYIPARVITATLDANGPSSYRVVWWSGNDRKVADVDPSEIRYPRLHTSRMKVGFVPNE